jgi:hypothetical protein
MGDVVALRRASLIGPADVSALTKELARVITSFCVSRKANSGDPSPEILNAIAAVVGTVLACSEPGPEQDELRATFERLVSLNAGAANIFSAANPGAIEGALYG